MSMNEYQLKAKHDKYIFDRLTEGCVETFKLLQVDDKVHVDLYTYTGDYASYDVTVFYLKEGKVTSKYGSWSYTFKEWYEDGMEGERGIQGAMNYGSYQASEEKDHIYLAEPEEFDKDSICENHEVSSEDFDLFQSYFGEKEGWSFRDHDCTNDLFQQVIDIVT